MSQFTYARRVTYVEAFQVPPDDEQTRAWPSWFMSAIACGALVPQVDGSIRITDKALGEGEVRVGMWLVKLEVGFAGMTKEQFDQNFEKPVTAAEPRA